MEFVESCCECGESYDIQDMDEYCSLCDSRCCKYCLDTDEFFRLKYENYKKTYDKRSKSIKKIEKLNPKIEKLKSELKMKKMELEEEPDKSKKSELEYELDDLESEFIDLNDVLEDLKYDLENDNDNSDADSDNEHIVVNNSELLDFEEWNNKIVYDGYCVQYKDRYNFKNAICKSCRTKNILQEKDDIIKKLKVMLLAQHMNLDLLKKIYEAL